LALARANSTYGRAPGTRDNPRRHFSVKPRKPKRVLQAIQLPIPAPIRR
jgi:hypothetical protein